MAIFFTKEIEGNYLHLEGDEYRHCIKSLRKKVGDLIKVTDGFGQCYLSKISSINKHSLKASIQESIAFEKQNFLQIAIAPTKNQSRIETFVEKATEIGVSDIHFIDFHYGEKPKLKMERIQKIALSAMKQSKQWWLPNLHPILSFTEFVNTKCILPAYYGHIQANLDPWISVTKNDISSMIVIGPEGHFHPKEIELMNEKGLKPCSLGSTVLRVETAGIVAASLFSQRNKI